MSNLALGVAALGALGWWFYMGWLAHGWWEARKHKAAAPMEDARP